MGPSGPKGDRPRRTRVAVAAAIFVRPDGRHHHLENLSVFDGSVFPTSLGANPQLSIYGITARNASRLAKELAARPGAAASAPP